MYNSGVQLVTSFDRNGNFPLEANYIFPTVEELVTFYSDPVLAGTLHKGLLKVVEKDPDGNQALYWVTKKAGVDELEFTRLISGSLTSVITNVSDLLRALNTEIEARKAADTALWGTDDPSDIDQGYASIVALVNKVKQLEQASSGVSGPVLELIKAIVGTTSNDIPNALDSLPYKSLIELANALNNALAVPEGSDPNAIDSLRDVLQFLSGISSDKTLRDVLDDQYKKVLGNPLPSSGYRTLRGIEDDVVAYKTITDNKLRILQEEVDAIEASVGLDGHGGYSPDASTNYLSNATSVMNALHILDDLVHRQISGNTPSVRNEDPAVSLGISQEQNSYVLSSSIKLSTQAGNQIVKNNDGLFSKAKTYFENGTLTFKVNDAIISQHYIGMDAIVKTARYDKDNEQLVFEFKLDNGEVQTVLVPVDALIHEWEPENRDTSVIELHRDVDRAGTDKLSADVRISTKQGNILTKDGNSLYVSGTTESITHNGVPLKDLIPTLGNGGGGGASPEQIVALQSLIDTERTRATASERSLSDRIDSLGPHSEYTISKLDNPEQGASVTYALKKDGVETGDKINIPSLPETLGLTYKNTEGLRTLELNSEVVAYLTDVNKRPLVLRTTYNSTTNKLETLFRLNDNNIQKIESDFSPMFNKIGINPDGTLVREPSGTDSSSKIASTSWVKNQLKSVSIGNSNSTLEWIDV